MFGRFYRVNVTLCFTIFRSRCNCRRTCTTRFTAITDITDSTDNNGSHSYILHNKRRQLHTAGHPGYTGVCGGGSRRGPRVRYGTRLGDSPGSKAFQEVGTTTGTASALCYRISIIRKGALGRSVL